MIEITPATQSDIDVWAVMRHALWPKGSLAEHRAEIEASLEAPHGTVVNLIARNMLEPCGFAEAALRNDYVNGCDTSPVAFLEGIYVVPEARGRGVARALIATVEGWAVERGCTEFASDAVIDNVASAAMHKALGFAETQRVVYFRKVLAKT